MDNTLPLSNRLRILFVAIFILIISGVIGYITLSQYSNRAGEFPVIQASDLTPSSAILNLVGSTQKVTSVGTVYDVVIDTKGEVVSSVNLDFIFPGRDVTVSIEKGNIAEFQNGVNSSSIDKNNDKFKLQFATADGKTFKGSGVLVKLTLKRLDTATSESATINLANTSYIKLVGYNPKGFSATSVKSFVFELGPVSNVATSSSTSTSSSSSTSSSISSSQTSTSSSVSSSVSTQSQSSTASSVSTSASTLLPSSSSSSTMSVANTSSSSSSSISTSAVSTVTTSSTSSTTSVSQSSSASVVSTTSSKISSSTSASSSKLPTTAAASNTDYFAYIYLSLMILGLGIAFYMKMYRKEIFEKEFE
jgi:hypothetical protein